MHVDVHGRGPERLEHKRQDRLWGCAGVWILSLPCNFIAYLRVRATIERFLTRK